MRLAVLFPMAWSYQSSTQQPQFSERYSILGSRRIVVLWLASLQTAYAASKSFHPHMWEDERKRSDTVASTLEEPKMSLGTRETTSRINRSYVVMNIVRRKKSTNIVHAVIMSRKKDPKSGCSHERITIKQSSSRWPDSTIRRTDFRS